MGRNRNVRPCLAGTASRSSGHVLPAFGHAAAKIGAAGTAAPKSAEEDPAQRQNSERLPKGDMTPAKERRQQPIPQVHYQLTTDGNNQQDPQNASGAIQINFFHLGLMFSFLMLRIREIAAAADRRAPHIVASEQRYARLHLRGSAQYGNFTKSMRKLNMRPRWKKLIWIAPLGVLGSCWLLPSVVSW